MKIKDLVPDGWNNPEELQIRNMYNPAEVKAAIDTKEVKPKAVTVKNAQGEIVGHRVTMSK